jgi:hypothetical protein
MIPVIPWYIELVSLATNFAVAAGVWLILSSAASRSGLPPNTQRKVRIGTGLFLAAWLGTALALAPAPDTLLARDQFFLTPLIPLFIVGPVSLVLLAIGLSGNLRRVLAAASLPAIIGVQLYRTIGLLFLILLAQGQIPAHFALPAGWGDIAVGLSAPILALALARGSRGARPLAITWNGLGLLDLVIAVGMGSGFLAPLLAPDLGARVPPAAAMGVFPMILVPTFAVPVSVLLHLVALARLWGQADIGWGSRAVSELTPGGAALQR